jgi:hypothetical protein
VADGVRNLVYMAGHKFGAADNPSLTWMMNVGVPAMVAETFREMRIVTFSTACVYPFVAVDGPGAAETTPAVPPPGDYAWSCVGRERMFEHGSQRWARRGGWCGCPTPSTCATACCTTWPARSFTASRST